MRAAFYINFLIPLAVSLCWLKTGHQQVLVNSNETVTVVSDDLTKTTGEQEVTAQFLAAIVVNVTNGTSGGLAHANRAVKDFIFNFILANNLKVCFKLDNEVKK